VEEDFRWDGVDVHVDADVEDDVDKVLDVVDEEVVDVDGSLVLREKIDLRFDAFFLVVFVAFCTSINSLYAS